jgi:ParB/RepB/Spo0J family partition protein
MTQTMRVVAVSLKSATGSGDAKDEAGNAGLERLGFTRNGQFCQGLFLLRYENNKGPFSLVAKNNGKEKEILTGKVFDLERSPMGRITIFANTNGELPKVSIATFRCDQDTETPALVTRIIPQGTTGRLMSSGSGSLPGAPKKSEQPTQNPEAPQPVTLPPTRPMPAPPPKPAAVAVTPPTAKKPECTKSAITEPQKPALPASHSKIIQFPQETSAVVAALLASSEKKVLKLRVARIRPFKGDEQFKGQPRDEFDERELIGLSKSLKKHEQQAYIKVIPITDDPDYDWEIVDGERRLRAAQITGQEFIEAVLSKASTKQQQHLEALIANFNRSGHSPIELSNALAQQVAAGTSVSDLSEALNLSDATIYQSLRLQKLHPELRDLMRKSVPKKQRLRKIAAVELSRIPDQQKQLEIYRIAVKEESPKLIELKIEELGRPFFPTNKHGRTWKPSDFVPAAKRIVLTLKADALRLESLPMETITLLLESMSENEIGTLLKELNEDVARIQGFVARITRARIAKRKQGAATPALAA